MSRAKRRAIALIALVTAVAVVFLGARRQRARAARRALVERVVSYGKALTDFEACLTRGAPGDFTTAVVLAHPTGFRSNDPALEACRERFDATLASFGATARALGIVAPPNIASRDTISRDALPSPQLGAADPLREIDRLCSWVFDAHRDLEVMFEAVKRPPPPDVDCFANVAEHHEPKLLPTLGGLLSLARVYPPQIVVRGASTPPSLRDVAAFIPSADDEDPEAVIGRSLDGERWAGIDVPADVVIAAPAGAGFVAVARGRMPAAPWEVRTHDGQHGGWTVAGTLPARRDALLLQADGARLTLVATRPGAPDVVEVVTSTDGGKRFGAPRKLVDRAAAAALDVRAMADGTVVAIALPRAAPAEVEVARLAPDAAAAAVTKLPLAAPPAEPELVACNGRASHYAVVGRRFVVGSGDGGATWAQLADLGERTWPARVYCAAERVIVEAPREDDVELRACTGKACDPPAAAAGNVAVLFARAPADELEVWLASPYEIEHADHRGYLVRVYTLARGALAPTRFFVMRSADRNSAATHFVDLGDGIAWVDPRSGAGTIPWLTKPPQR